MRKLVVAWLVRRRTGGGRRLTPLRPAVRENLLRQVDEGSFPSADEVHIALRRGEHPHLELEAELLKEVVDREYRGGDQGVSIPIVKGVRTTSVAVAERS